MTTEKTEGRPHHGAAPIVTEAARVSLFPEHNIAADSSRTTTRPGDGGPEAWRRSQFPHDLRCRRRISRELDSLCGGALVARVDVVHLKAREVYEILRRLEVETTNADTGDYWADVGLTLGMPQRVTAGRVGRVSQWST